MNKKLQRSAIAIILVVITGLRAIAMTGAYGRSIEGRVRAKDVVEATAPGYGSAGLTDKVSFSLTDPGQIIKDFSCVLTLRVDYLERPDQKTPESSRVQLKLNYSLKNRGADKLKDSYTFRGAYWMRVTVEDVHSPEFGDELPPAFALTADIDGGVKPGPTAGPSLKKGSPPRLYTAFSSSSSIKNSSATLNGGNQLQLYWSQDMSATEYDVEWTTVDSGRSYIDTVRKMADSTSGTLSNTFLNNIFLHNATRVTTADTSYLLSLCYNDKYIVVRIRSVAYSSAGIRLAGAWDYRRGSGSYAVWALNWYQSSVNWQYSAAFAEEAKKKEVVSYFDGTLRGRQTATLDNSDNVAVVQENIYDEFGRPTASILPAPQHNTSGTTPYLHYFQNLNRNSADSVYNAANVMGGIAADSCEFSPDTLNSVSGAALYYSPRNAFLTDVTSPNYKRFNFYIPDAQGYPLSVTQYTGDNTGRIKYQGGVGRVFQPGSSSSPNKITRYFYAKPEQWELDQLFGNDVGYASHYLKNMVEDPNGQVSISYINASGKTIATALAGLPPAGMDSLKSIVPATTVTVDLLPPGQFVFDPAALTLSAATTYLSPLAGAPATFKYSIRKLVDKFPADSLDICSNCYYKLTIKVSDDCGDIIYNNTTPVQIGSATAACDSTGIKTDSLNVTLANIGEYYISFRFAFDKTVIDTYADSVVSKGQEHGVIKTEFNFILPFLDSLDFKPCLSDCTTCEQTLGSEANFMAMVQTKLVALDVDTTGATAAINTWAGGEYTVLKAYCDSLHAHCDSSATASPCQQYMQPMQDDVSPGGQYALFDTQDNALDTANNVIYKNWRAQFPAEPPADSLYQSALITLPDGTITSPYDSTFTYELLVQYWQAGWSSKFLQYHPEYCKLLFCENNEHYELWDQTVQDSILLAGQIPDIPYAPSGFHYDYTNGAWLVAGDPFFQSGAAGAGLAAAFENDLENYTHNVVNNPGASVKDLVKFVDYLLYCGPPGAATNTLNNPLNNWDNCAPDPACRVPDREWDSYKEFYFTLKQQYYNKLRLTTTCAGKCTVGTPTTLPTNSACAAVSDFAIADYSSGDGAPAATCGSTMKLVTLTYVPGNVAAKVTVTVSYAQGAAGGLPATFTFNKGDRNKMFCVPDSLPVQSITIQNAVCDSCQVNPLVFNTWQNDHIIQTVYGSGGTIISAKTLHIDTQVYFPGTLSIKPGNTYDAVTTFHPYSGSWELNDSCQFALYSQNVRYILKSVTADSLALTYRQGNFEETWYYAGTGLSVTCSSPDTINVMAVQGTNAYFKGVYPTRHLVTVIPGTSGSPPAFTCVNSSGTDTTSTSTYHTCLSVYTPYSIVKYQDVWVFDCVYDNVPADCPPELLTRVSRFPNTFTTPVIGDTTTVIAQNQAALNSQVTSTCAANAGNWMTALGPGLIPYSADTAALKAALIAICGQGGDLAHPFGASTVPPGETGPGGYNSFGDAIKGILGISTFTTSLNPWLIGLPYPYTPQMQGNYLTISNTSQPICALLALYQHQCDSVNTAHGTSLTLYQYLSQTFGSAMGISSATVDSLKKSCLSCNFVLDQDVTLPVFLAPGSGGCVMPSDYTTAQSALLTAFGGSIDTTNVNYQTIYSNFMNQRWGFMLSYDQYKDYEDSLISNPTKMLCNGIVSEPPPADTLACIETQIAVGVANGKSAYNAYIDSVKNAFEQSYVYVCSNAGEDVQMRTRQKMYHYTLYYYDQADNLVRTVPPEGVSVLTAQQIAWVDSARNSTLNCTYTGPATNASKTTAFNALSSTLSASLGAIELWLYEDGTTQNHLAEITPDNKYLFQLNVVDTALAIDIYPAVASGTTGITFSAASIHYRANISPRLPLGAFTHVVLQGDSLGSANSAQLYLNGTHFTATKIATPAGSGFTVTSTITGPVGPDSIQTLKHLRLYSQPLDTLVIRANANNNCLMPTDTTYMTGWYRFNVPSPGGPTTINDSSTVETRLPSVYPPHVLVTNYYYNSTNQVSTQNSPDGGTNRFWYDLLSRLTFSQNDKQLPAEDYSYTKYDSIGRITEVGQKHTTTALGNPDYLQDTTISHFYTLGVDSQVTVTYYDVKPTPGSGIQNHPQDNLRKRVSATTYQVSQADTVSQATYYDYDIDGNVNNLYQQIAGLGAKRLYYEYDLVSGKVNFVGYQNGRNDQFYYQYVYDADNRITQAWASVAADTTAYGFGSKLDPATQKLDAAYQYYLQGPLARMELGDVSTKVQGVDYAYTLQGWVKGVNSVYGTSTADMGQDGISGDKSVATDAYGYSLGYYPGDYKPVGDTSYAAFTPAFSQTTGDITGQSLYNGDISNGTLSLAPLAGGPSYSIVGYTYGYDQLNRVKRARQYTIPGTTWNRSNILLNYQENITYDGNGNILTFGRNGNYPTTAQTIDSLTYHYSLDDNGKLLNNKLNYINDAIDSSGYNLDLRNQTSATNYQYDGIGNLIKDASAGITNIGWTVYGKIDTIFKTAGNITYTYNTASERISKTEGGLTTWYVRDAQGNVLAIYDNKSDSLYWREQHLYGSSRIGMWQPNMNVATGSSSSIWSIVGNKNYELVNHLGNVMATITDARIAVRFGSLPVSPIIYYRPTITSTQDYYAFGMLQPGRQITPAGDSTYRYGFNGKENDNEVKGLGNQQDYGMRIYDDRVGRFLSGDLLENSFPWNSSYAYAENDPISSIDLDGLEKVNPNWFIAGLQGITNGIKDFIKDSNKGIKSLTSKQTYVSVKNNVSDMAAVYTGKPGGAATTAAFYTKASRRLSSTITSTVESVTVRPINFVLTMNNRSKSDNAYQLGYPVGYNAIPFIFSEFGSEIMASYSTAVKTENILFSQQSVNDLSEIVSGMRSSGWSGPPIDLVELEGGKFGTLDNTRVLAAHDAGVDVQAIVHQQSDLLTPAEAERFKTKKGGTPKTWGDAYKNRIGKQNAAYRKAHPNGSYTTSGSN